MTSNELLNKYEKELIDLEKNYTKYVGFRMNRLAHKTEGQIELVRRFIKDLKKLLV